MADPLLQRGFELLDERLTEVAVRIEQHGPARPPLRRSFYRD
jgi:hypothetical protein